MNMTKARVAVLILICIAAFLSGRLAVSAFLAGGECFFEPAFGRNFIRR